MNLAAKETIANPHLEQRDRIALPPGSIWEEVLYMWGIAECACTHPCRRGEAISPKHHRLIACHRFHGTGSEFSFYTAAPRRHEAVESWRCAEVERKHPCEFSIVML